MKLQLNKLMAGLVMAGSVVALVGCGDGGSPTLGASSNVTTPINATNLAAAQTVTKALGSAGADFKLATAIVFDANVTNPGAGVPTIPANSVLNINPTTVPGSIGDFKITAPNTTKTVEGILLHGSCNFQVTGPVDTAQLLDGYTVGSIFRIGTCGFTMPTATVNALVGLVPSTMSSSTMVASPVGAPHFTASLRLNPARAL